MLLLSINTALPLEDPVLKFLILLIIILAAPLLLNKIKVPHLIGLIIAGAVIGPHGFNILSRDSNIVVTGTTGLLYIMFLAGLEIDMGDFKKNKWKSLGFGIYTFVLPFILGYASAFYLLKYNFLTSLLFASLFSSHTLIAYPLLGKFGITKNRSVNITVGGTMITDILALLTLAAVVGMSQGNVGRDFWLTMGVSILIFGMVVLLLFPVIGRWFFKNVDDKISQYIFVLVMIYLASLFAEIAGVEAIIGAFLAGLALNRLIPHTSSLMNRIEFVGNAIFIPFFLISVGMLIDFTAFFKSWETITVAAVMMVCSIGGKYIAAIATQKTFAFSNAEGGLIFGLSSASAAATLATVMVGYNIILSENELGQPVRLLNEHVLNGSILLILVSCTLSSFVTMSNARKIAKSENEDTLTGKSYEDENILLALNHPETVERMMNLSMLIKQKDNHDRIYAVNVISAEKSESSIRNADKVLNEAVTSAAAADVTLHPIVRHDSDVVKGIKNVIREKNITDLIIGIKDQKGFSPSLIYNIYNGYLKNNQVNLLVYHAVQPVSTIKIHHVFLPPQAENQAGFFHALLRIWNIIRNSGAQADIFAYPETVEVLRRIIKKSSIEATITTARHGNEIEKYAPQIGTNEGLIVMMDSRVMEQSRHTQFIPDVLQRKFADVNYMLIYPYTDLEREQLERRSISNHDDYIEIGNIIGTIFK